MAQATLILLAGGRSTRFGRPKQLEPVGPHGEALMDHTLRDAFACGCADAIIVVRPEYEGIFSERFRADPRISIVVQHEARGTAHATMLALEGITTSAVLANADDHYGAAAITMAVQHAFRGNVEEHALVAFRLANTLSGSGGVNRAICRINTSEELLSTQEVLGLNADSLGVIKDATGRTWSGDEIVSMNLWILRPNIFPLFRSVLDAGLMPGTEFGLPTVVDAAIARAHRFRVIPTNATWCGLTYPDDAELVRRMLAEHP